MPPNSPLAHIAHVDLERLKWRSRRGMLENDLVLQTFYARHGDSLTETSAAGLNEVLDLIDGDLWDILVRRKLLSDVKPDASAAAHEIITLLHDCEAAKQ